MWPHRQGRVYKVDDLHLLGIGIESTVQELVALDRLVQLLLAHLLVGQGPRIDGVTDPVEALGVLAIEAVLHHAQRWALAANAQAGEQFAPSHLVSGWALYGLAEVVRMKIKKIAIIEQTAGGSSLHIVCRAGQPACHHHLVHIVVVLALDDGAEHLGNGTDALPVLLYEIPFTKFVLGSISTLLSVRWRIFLFGPMVDLYFHLIPRIVGPRYFPLPWLLSVCLLGRLVNRSLGILESDDLVLVSSILLVFLTKG